MLTIAIRLGGVCAIVGLVACGGPGKAKEPTDKPASSDEVPKWEGAAATNPNAPSKSSGKVLVREAPTRRSDEYDKEATDVVLKRAARQVKDNCGHAKDADGKATGPWGKVTIQVQLGSNGHSKGTTIPAPFQGKPTGACIEKAFSKLTFPPWAGSDTQVDWEVELVEPGKESK
ncbi:MAG TPA: hypothetical protein VM580_01460 [Labilithrix sp.]|nr:hypothetical protein [Labilithrix sp.]